MRQGLIVRTVARILHRRHVLGQRVGGAGGDRGQQVVVVVGDVRRRQFVVQHGRVGRFYLLLVVCERAVRQRPLTLHAARVAQAVQAVQTVHRAALLEIF